MLSMRTMGTNCGVGWGWAVNFVCEGALGGGVSRSLCLDNYGKSLSSRILSFEIEINDDFKNLLH